MDPNLIKTVLPLVVVVVGLIVATRAEMIIRVRRLLASEPQTGTAQ